jgi:hypothetical protein
MLLLDSRERIAALLPLIEHEPLRSSGRQGAFFDRLPEHFTVYRGGSRVRINGAISWTTDVHVAEGFARHTGTGRGQSQTRSLHSLRRS